jgi:large subunit ribosomal protein L17
MRRNLAQSIFEHGQIRTTLPKAKDVRPFVERLITLARKAHGGDLIARRQLIRLMNDRAIIPDEHRAGYDVMSDAQRSRVLRARSGARHRTGAARGGLDFTAESVVHRLVNTIAPRYVDRPGGYTRIIKLPRTRIGDNGAQAILQLVGEEETPGSVTKPRKTSRRKKVEARYAFATRAARSRGGKSAGKGKSGGRTEGAGDQPVESSDNAGETA